MLVKSRMLPESGYECSAAAIVDNFTFANVGALQLAKNLACLRASVRSTHSRSLFGKHASLDCNSPTYACLASLKIRHTAETRYDANARPHLKPENGERPTVASLFAECAQVCFNVMSAVF